MYLLKQPHVEERTKVVWDLHELHAVSVILCNKYLLKQPRVEEKTKVVLDLHELHAVSVTSHNQHDHWMLHHIME